MVNPVLSIIIPCYNSGTYLPDALESIATYPDKSVYEVIIINDGSTDEHTISLLSSIKGDNLIILNQENKGPAAARNAGVKKAKGEYLLLLDADNKISSDYISKGLEIFSKHPDISIIHADPVFFGDTTTPRFHTGKFDMNRILIQNYIDNCTLIRKKAWEELNGQDENRLIMSHADWDLWIRAGAAGYQFYYINKSLFHYRILNNSMVQKYTEQGGNDPILKYIYSKHPNLIANYYNSLYNQFVFYQDDQKRPFRSFIKYFYNKYLKKS